MSGRAVRCTVPAMRRLGFIALALACAASCKKDNNSGLPPATDWKAPPPGAQGKASPHGGAAANPHGGAMGNPHGPGAMGGNPHAGNPHAGMDVSGDGGGTSHGAVPQQTAPKTLEAGADGRLALGPFTLAAPKEWTQKPITSSMRAAHFVLPGKAAGAESEMIIYYFGEEGAGSWQANLDRWVDQFQQPDGKSSKAVAKTEKATFAGQEANIVTVSGRYVTTTMPGGGDPIDRADQAMIAAIVGSPKGPYYFKLVGPKATVDAQAPKVRAMLASLKLR